MDALVAVQAELKEIVRASHLRADSAHALVDLAVILDVVDTDAYKRRFFAPRVLQVLTRETA